MWTTRYSSSELTTPPHKALLEPSRISAISACHLPCSGVKDGIAGTGLTSHPRQRAGAPQRPHRATSPASSQPHLLRCCTPRPPAAQDPPAVASSATLARACRGSQSSGQLWWEGRAGAGPDVWAAASPVLPNHQIPGTDKAAPGSLRLPQAAPGPDVQTCREGTMAMAGGPSLWAASQRLGAAVAPARRADRHRLKPWPDTY